MNWCSIPGCVTINGNGAVPGNANDPDLPVGLARGGGSMSSGGHGYIVLYYWKKKDSLQVALPSLDTVCEGDTVLLTPVISGGTPPYSVMWSSAQLSILCDTCLTTAVIATQSGNVVVTVRDRRGCMQTDTLQFVLDQLSMQISAPGPLCEGTPFTVSVTGNALTGVSSMVWSGPNGFTHSGSSWNSVANPAYSGQYTVTLISQAGCTLTETFNLWVQPLPLVQVVPSDTVVPSGIPLRLWVLPDTLSYLWYALDGMILREMGVWAEVSTPPPQETFVYVVCGTDNLGCTRCDTAYVRGLELPDCSESAFWLPNAFTPNGNGLNDTLYVYGVRPGEVVEWRIYDRWGQEVFRAADIPIVWSGRSFRSLVGWSGRHAEHSEVLRTDVYVYWVAIRCGRRTYFYRGDVTLLR